MSIPSIGLVHHLRSGDIEAFNRDGRLPGFPKNDPPADFKLVKEYSEEESGNNWRKVDAGRISNITEALSFENVFNTSIKDEFRKALEPLKSFFIKVFDKMAALNKDTLDSEDFTVAFNEVVETGDEKLASQIFSATGKLTDTMNAFTSNLRQLAESLTEKSDQAKNEDRPGVFSSHLEKLHDGERSPAGAINTELRSSRMAKLMSDMLSAA